MTGCDILNSKNIRSELSMPNHSNKVVFSIDELTRLEKLSRSRTSEMQFVTRAKILLYKNDGMNNHDIAEKLDINRNSVSLCLSKYYSAGIDAALNDVPKQGKPCVITQEDTTWIINLACQKPKDFGYAAELWTYRSLQQHIRKTCIENGYPNLARIAFSKVQSILNGADVKPFKIKYYLEKRDPDFDSKMHEILLVYKQIELCFDNEGKIIPTEDPRTITISYDEKPGIQAISCTAPDKLPTIGHGFVARDSEYKRLGTLSFLAGMDLITGEIIPLVSDTHKSSDFITFLKILDAKYPEGDVIQIILDNHSAHTSKEIRNYLANKPGRFVFVFTPKHGSWLNLIESFFSKMTKQLLHGIRVSSKEELKQRIYQYIQEINGVPVVYHWTYKMDDVELDNA